MVEEFGGEPNGFAASARNNVSEGKIEKIITVFGSSRPREGDADYAEARSLGSALARAGFAVCSGRIWRRDGSDFARRERSRKERRTV